MMMGMPAPVDPAMKKEMKVQAVGTAITALIGIAFIRITPAILEGVGLISE